jgi:hypothetical protein
MHKHRKKWNQLCEGVWKQKATAGIGSSITSFFKMRAIQSVDVVAER